MRQKINFYYFVLFVYCSSFFACSNHPSNLGYIRNVNIPYYVSSSILWGDDAESTTKLNKYRIIRGVIDTTDENPPIHIAMIQVNHASVQMDLIKRDTSDNKIIEEYKSSEYYLKVIFSRKKIPDGDICFEGIYRFQKENEQEPEFTIVGIEGNH